MRRDGVAGTGCSSRVRRFVRSGHAAILRSGQNVRCRRTADWTSMSVPLTLPVPTVLSAGAAGTTSPVPFPVVLELGEHRLRLLDRARIYACGITPYDVTHLGHAA